MLYFYPKDNTPDCTKEACAMRDNYENFKKIKVKVIEVSANSINSHFKFSQKYSLSFPLLSDLDKKISKYYNATGLFRRKSYLISPEGKIAKIYTKVKPTEHSNKVLNDLSILQNKDYY